eukprot:6442440-Alexandrium_andersonii.AAC.1
MHNPSLHKPDERRPSMFKGTLSCIRGCCVWDSNGRRSVRAGRCSSASDWGGVLFMLSDWAGSQLSWSR